MRTLRSISAIVITLASSLSAHAQQEADPVMIKINRIALGPKSKYAIYIPTFEFHILFQKEFNVLKSSVSADYDYRRQDMGFGMSHSIRKYIVSPGVNVDDNLYFREVFSDSTGFWRRKQSISPFLLYELGDHSSVGLEFKVEREWSPKRRMGTKIVSNHDRSLKLFYVYRTNTKEPDNYLFYINIERSYRIFKGEFNYFLLDIFGTFSKTFSHRVRYKSMLGYHGNLTPQESPLFFLGGRSNLIGYENDELWGRKAFSIQNLLELTPYPDYSLSVGRAHFRRLSVLTQLDIGRVKDSKKYVDMKQQDSDIKFGLGIGIGFNTDLPYMPSTDIHLLIGVPSTDMGDIKYYAGFGGWIN